MEIPPIEREDARFHLHDYEYHFYMDTIQHELPPVIAGPLLRRVEPTQLVLWLVGSRPLEGHLELSQSRPGLRLKQRIPLDESCCQRLPLGKHAWLHLIEVQLEQPLPTDTLIHYDLLLNLPQGQVGVANWAPHLLYSGQQQLGFVLRQQLDQLLHGSCRKPHHPSGDGLINADRVLSETVTNPCQRPAVLLLTGDQIYADDVAGPMLSAIHQLIQRLGLFDEQLSGASVQNSQTLYEHAATYYQREQLLPDYTSNEALRERFFGGIKKPIFTTTHAHNHLVSLGEVLAMYLLVWSPVPWTLIDTQAAPQQVPPEFHKNYAEEQTIIEAFAKGLPHAARALAQIPTLMIFDDHDVTDDWNLSARWEETAYQHPYSRRIVGNALLGYLLCQGWGNAPQRHAGLIDATRHLMAGAQDNYLDAKQQDVLINQLLHFKDWHYSLPTQPPLLVLNTRTRRWRSERNLSWPSGLMDWEALCELQNELLDKPAAVIVSPAPIFGVKLIEAIQRLFTWAGYPLLVDAENWMAHRGAAQVILSIFRHSRTPANYVILSGDVHYSFAYDVRIRHHATPPHLWQITSSGIKNEFPRPLLRVFDCLNRWLYAPQSPLNWFTKRRQLEVSPRTPDRSQQGERLWNSAGIGQVFLDSQGRPERIYQLNADGSPATCFMSPASSRPRAPETKAKN